MYQKIIIRPILTEKMAIMQERQNKYGFIVSGSANKVQIKSAIESKFDVKTIEKVTSESENLNDHQRSSIINQYVSIKKYNQKQIDALLSDVKEVYLADGNFDKYEQSIFKMLKKIMKA